MMKVGFASMIGGGVLAFSMMAASAHATEIYTSNLSAGTSTSGTPGGYQLGYNGSISGMTTTGYNFIYTSASAAINSGANGMDGMVYMDSAIKADANDTQDHGAFLALDGDYDTYPVDIAVSTVAGQTYTVSFDWAAAQQAGFSGGTTDSVLVALGNDPAQGTGVVSVAQQGFSGWMDVTDTFVAQTTGTEELSFLAAGSPAVPPFALVDNIDVSTAAAPEPNSLMLLGTGLAALGGFVRMRLKSGEPANA